MFCADLINESGLRQEPTMVSSFSGTSITNNEAECKGILMLLKLVAETSSVYLTTDCTARELELLCFCVSFGISVLNFPVSYVRTEKQANWYYIQTNVILVLDFT